MNEIKDESETVEKLHENTVLYTGMVRMLRAICQAELARKKRDELLPLSPDPLQPTVSAQAEEGAAPSAAPPAEP